MDYQSKESGYGKMALWQWIFIYVVVAGIVYGLFYYFVLGGSAQSVNNNTSSTNNIGGSSSANVQTQPIY